VWFLAREGFDAYGIDGSNTAIAKAAQRLPEEGLRASLQVGDVISLRDFYPSVQFDAVVDVACLQHNRVKAVETILDPVVAVLKPDGRVFSMMVAAGSYGEGLGRETEPGTFVDVKEGPLSGLGRCHFFNLEEVQHLFKRFADVRIEYSVRSLNDRRQSYKHWVAEGVRRL
jgi:SAM-dependent methyltransferase